MQRPGGRKELGVCKDLKDKLVRAVSEGERAEDGREWMVACHPLSAYDESI